MQRKRAVTYSEEITANGVYSNVEHWLNQQSCQVPLSVSAVSHTTKVKEMIGNRRLLSFSSYCLIYKKWRNQKGRDGNTSSIVDEGKI